MQRLIPGLMFVTTEKVTVLGTSVSVMMTFVSMLLWMPENYARPSARSTRTLKVTYCMYVRKTVSVLT